LNVSLHNFLIQFSFSPFDLALNESFSDFQEAKLPPYFSFEQLQGGQWHGTHATKMLRLFKTFTSQKP